MVVGVPPRALDLKLVMPQRRGSRHETPPQPSLPCLLAALPLRC